MPVPRRGAAVGCSGRGIGGLCETVVGRGPAVGVALVAVGGAYLLVDGGLLFLVLG